MNPKIQMTGRLIAAGRTLAGISQEDFAGFVGLPVESLCQLEAKGSAWIDPQEDAERISQGLDQIGIVVVGETGGLGAGVRLKFTRQDVRQVTRLENEGGNVGCDSAP
jgi:transcriptional regulator with XRE-family HTH domain